MRNQDSRESGIARRAPLARRHTRDADGFSSAIVYSKELHLDFERRVIVVRGKTVHLAPKEYELLRYLVANRGRPVSHLRVLQTVWGPAFGDQRERLRVVVNELRKKIEVDPAKPKYIVTEFCVGYRFVFPDGARIQQTHSAGS